MSCALNMFGILNKHTVIKYWTLRCYCCTLEISAEARGENALNHFTACESGIQRLILSLCELLSFNLVCKLV